MTVINKVFNFLKNQKCFTFNLTNLKYDCMPLITHGPNILYQDFKIPSNMMIQGTSFCSFQ